MENMQQIIHAVYNVIRVGGKPVGDEQRVVYYRQTKEVRVEGILDRDAFQAEVRKAAQARRRGQLHLSLDLSGSAR